MSKLSIDQPRWPHLYGFYITFGHLFNRQWYTLVINMSRTKVTTEDIEKYSDDEDYHVDMISVRAKNLERGERYIEACKKLHRECGCFIKYACVCNPRTGFMKWFIVYKTDEYEKLDLRARTDAIWNEIFPEAPAASECAYGTPTSGGIYTPCTCPFSGE